MKLWLPTFPLITLLLSITLSGETNADWQGGIEGGTIIQDSGNSTRLRFKLVNDDRPLNHQVYVDWIRSEAGHNSYEAGYKPKYWFSAQWYAFGEGSIRVDKALQLEQETMVQGGMGFSAINTQTQSLQIELGVGQIKSEFESGWETSEVIGLARLSARQVLSDLLKIELDGDIISGETLTESQGEVGVSMRISTGAVKLSYRYRYRQVNQDNAETFSDSDTALSFSYGF